MTKQEILERFCKLSSKVADHFKHQKAADCFCHELLMADFHLHFEVMEVIEEAVNEWIANHPRYKLSENK